ncbi:pyrophosphatase PpaX [Clostridium sp. CF011]|uniref:pyrophosphatase PpaX n=1 Tax=unclassified Clostridium TaxID=2614128 RepID=UPI001C0B7B14|nr:MULTISPECIES: pyrophosphatase PpaX [unclassified Clostridium]MBU3092419.1 pyrophosphatase PpaX [Clostridium sp. CF011]MBW9146047.1 pyrophosphatase PpaX [Clostridium sp. CM027]UVE39516.1 pyrophosphatase PpaX [Clostridium sp. CM027]WAG68430.1 pyrophosphatase PpaX [Clostridium sp. CF011]
MAIRNILFDLDGTLLDTNELIIQSFQHTYKMHLNKQVDKEEIIKNFGEILKITLDREFGDDSEEAIKTYRRFQTGNFEKLITIHKGVREGIIELHRQGYNLGIVTSRLNDSAIKGLKHFGLMDYFESIIGADDTDQHKPDPTPALMALKELKGKPEETIFVGDSPFDVLCAKNAKITSVVVGWSALPMDMILKYEPDYVVNSMEEFMRLVEKVV